MAQEQSKAQVWAKPELTKLGKIADVAGPAGSGAQAAGGGQNRS